jgi:EmrB/QacA subfamily drug resistance transporter
MSVFLIASALCGLSNSMTQLIVFRGIQGIGGGTLISNAFIIVGEIFPPRQRGKYIGLVASMFGVASILGPSVGGVITDSLSWRWVFYVNIPVGFLAFFMLLFFLPSLKQHEGKRRIDIMGIASFLFAVFPLLLGFSEGGRDYAWSSPQEVGLFAVSAVMFGLFIFIESRAEEPLLSLDLFKNKVFSISVMTSLLSGAAMFGTVIFVPLFAQSVLGASATTSGFITTPMMLGVMGASSLGGILISRLNRYRPIGLVGFVVALMGSALLAFMGTHASYPFLLFSLLLLGAGTGVSIPVFTMAAQNVFPSGQLGVVTSALQFFRNIGGTVSSAVFGSVMLASLHGRLKVLSMASVPDRVQIFLKDPKFLGNPDAIEKIRSNMPGGLVGAFNAALGQARTALALSIQSVFLISVFVLGTGFVITLFLNERRVQKAADEQHSDFDTLWNESERLEATEEK